MNPSIERVQEKDLKELKQLILEEFPYTKPKIEGIMQRYKRQNVLLLKAVKDSVLAGFIDFELNGLQGLIVGLSVKKEFRRQGIASRLLEGALSALREGHCLEARLIVRQDNVAAIKLYEKAGFRKTRILPKKIDNAVVQEMTLSFNEGFGYAA
jgi:ribosomal-protein-alanine N-acetyltransferase